MSNVKNTSGLRPVGVAVLVKPYKVESVSSGGIIIADEAVKRDQLAEQRAVIIEIGPCAWRSEPQPRAAVGDKVLFSKWAGYNTKGPADGGDYRIVNDSDIFTVITEGE